MDEQISKSDLQDLLKSLGQDGENGDSIVTLLALPDEQFAYLAPQVMEQYQRSLNNPSDKIMLSQSFNAMGKKVEDFGKEIGEIKTYIENSKFSKIKRDFLNTIVDTILNTIASTEGIAKRIIRIPMEICNIEAKAPTYAHLTDSGMDVYALEDITINPGETKLILTGIKVALPPGYELQVRPKSGRSLKSKLRVANTPGTIDAGYRDEIGIIMENIEAPIKDITVEDGKVTSIEYGKAHTIGKGEKFVQLVLCEVPKAVFEQIESVGAIENDGRNGGYGSSGDK